MKIQKSKVYVRTNQTGSKSYYIEVGKVAGRRKRQFFKTRAEAEKFATTSAEERRNYGELAFQLNAEQRIDALKAFEKLTTVKNPATLVVIVDEYLRRNFPVGGEQTCAQVAEELVKLKTDKGMKPRYVRALRCVFDRFNRQFGTRLIHDVHAPEIETWLNSAKAWPNSQRASLNSQTLSALTRCNYIRDVGILFRYAVKHRYCTENPITLIDKPKVVETAVEVLTIGQALRLLLVARGRTKGKDRNGKTVSISLVPYIALGLFAGLRSSEIEAMDWDDISLMQRSIEVKAGVAKTSRRRTIEISDNLYAWLKPFEKMSGPVVFVGWQDRFKQIKELAEFENWPNNALRHSFASYHFAKHKNLAHTLSQTGHDNPKTFHRHYKQLVSPEDANRFWNIYPPRRETGWMMEPPPKKMKKQDVKKRLREANAQVQIKPQSTVVAATEDHDCRAENAQNEATG